MIFSFPYSQVKRPEIYLRFLSVRRARYLKNWSQNVDGLYPQAFLVTTIRVELQNKILIVCNQSSKLKHKTVVKLFTNLWNEKKKTF